MSARQGQNNRVNMSRREVLCVAFSYCSRVFEYIARDSPDSWRCENIPIPTREDLLTRGSTERGHGRENVVRSLGKDRKHVTSCRKEEGATKAPS